MTKDEQIVLLDKMVRKAIEARTESRKHIISVMCFAPEEQRAKLEEALAIIESSIQNVASYYARKKRQLLR